MSQASTDSRNRRRLVALIAAGVVLLLLAGVGIYGLLTGPHATTSTDRPKPTPVTTPPPTAPSRTPAPPQVPSVPRSTDPGYGYLIVIEHTIHGQTVATAYAHMWQSGIHVQTGDRVIAGQHIGDVGSSGMSTGPHLHFEVRPGGTSGEPIDSAAWLTQHAATQLPAATSRPPDACNPTGTPNPPSGFDGDPDRLVDDPTSSGQITARLLHLYQQTLTAFPDTKWACYSPRPGTKSEHPLGRACDLTFGNQIGHYPNPEQLETGWQVTNWMKDNADLLGVQYLIWQGKIWSVAREAEGWRPYNGGGMHDPNDVTGGHYDHLHVTVKAGA